MKKALVLSGGTMRGAFQAGALADILTSASFAPEAIYGTSVGSLNGAFLADRAGRAAAKGQSPDWVEIGNALQKFWLTEVTSFDKIGERRGGVGLLFSVLFNEFNGFVDTAPLRQLIRQEINIENLRRSPAKFFACAVNIFTSETVYASVDRHAEKMHDFILASAAIPGVMPLVMIGNAPYVDGGIREVAPLRQAIHDGADEIVCILCQTEKMAHEKFDHRNVIDLMTRLMDIVINETVNNDIETCRKINTRLDDAPKPITAAALQGKRKINLQVIRPALPVDIELENFTSQQVKAALRAGWEASQRIRRPG